MRATLACLALTLSACLYDEPFLPGTPAVLEMGLFGAWRCVSAEPADQDAFILTVTRVADQRLRAEFTAGDHEPTAFSAYAVSVGGKPFLNVQELDAGQPKKWIVARYILFTPSILHVQFARDEPFRDLTSKAQRLPAFRRELKRTQLFEDYCTCIRIKESSPAGS